jgi:hypothetical protein
MTTVQAPLHWSERNVARVAAMLALGAFFMLLISGRSPADLVGSPARFALMLAWPLVMAASWITGRTLPTAAYLVVGALLLRLAEFPVGGMGGSDVLAGTREAIEVLLRDGNPYDHYYRHTRPPGQPMPYPPAALLVHLPGYLLGSMLGVGAMVGVQLTQVASALIGLGLIAWLGAKVAWLPALPAMALYAGAPNLVNLSIDGSNDTAVGVALVGAVAAVIWATGRDWDRRAFVAAGVAGALAVGMKQTAVPLVMLLAVYVWRVHGGTAVSRYVIGAGVFLFVISLPFLLADPLVYVGGLLAFVGVHEDVFGWNIWALARDLGLPVWDSGSARVLNLVASTLALVVVLALPLRSLAGTVLAGTFVTLVVFLTARWTSYAYFALIAPAILVVPVVAWWDALRVPPADRPSEAAEATEVAQAAPETE